MRRSRTLPTRPGPSCGSRSSPDLALRIARVVAMRFPFADPAVRYSTPWHGVVVSDLSGSRLLVLGRPGRGRDRTARERSGAWSTAGM